MKTILSEQAVGRWVDGKYIAKNRVCLYSGCKKLFSPKNPQHKCCSFQCRQNYKRELKIRHVDFEIFAHDKFRCQYCGRMPRDGIRLTVDHIYPKVREGKSERFNLITACSECNSQKSGILLSKELVIELWQANKENFTYEEAKIYWEKYDGKKKNINGNSGRKVIQR